MKGCRCPDVVITAWTRYTIITVWSNDVESDSGLKEFVWGRRCAWKIFNLHEVLIPCLVRENIQLCCCCVIREIKEWRFMMKGGGVTGNEASVSLWMAEVCALRRTKRFTRSTGLRKLHFLPYVRRSRTFCKSFQNKSSSSSVLKRLDQHHRFVRKTLTDMIHYV